MSYLTSEGIRRSIETNQYYLTKEIAPDVRAGIERQVAVLECRLSEQLALEASPGYQSPKFEMPAWGTCGT